MQDYHGDKDHFEDAFDRWLSDIGGGTLLEWADKFGDIVFLEGQIAHADKMLAMYKTTL